MKSKEYKKKRENYFYRWWYEKGIEKAPIRMNFPQAVFNTVWQFIAWRWGLALVLSFVYFGASGLSNGSVLSLSTKLVSVTWIPFTVYTLYWAFRLADIIIYDKINYPKYVEAKRLHDENWQF